MEMGVFRKSAIWEFLGGNNRIDTLWAMAGIPQVNDNDRKRLNGRSCVRGDLWKG